MSYVINAVEYLVLDGLPLATPAWYTTEMSDLIGTAEVRGSDILVPFADGVRPQPRRPTVSQATVSLAVVGDTNPDGSAHASVRDGLRANCKALAWLASRNGVDAAGTRLAELHLDGETRVGRVHILRLRFARESAGYATGQLELSIPAGALL